MALVMGDVDWFKNYNDRNGHEAGNKLLRELGHVLKLSIREEDLLCRYGGEEFLFFLMGVKSVEEACPAHRAHPQERRGPLLRAPGVPAARQPDHVLRRDDVPEERRRPAGPLTRTELKRLAGEADLALAEAKGKSRPDLKPRGPDDVPVDKNRVCSFVWQEVGGDRKAGGGPRTDGSSARRGSTSATTSRRPSSSARTAASGSPRPSTSASKGRASSPTRPCRRARRSRRSWSSRTRPRPSERRSSIPRRAGGIRVSFIRG